MWLGLVWGFHRAGVRSRAVSCVGGRLLWSCLLAELRSFVRRFSCMLSECMRGVCSFSGSGGGPSVAIGQKCWARSRYALSIVMMWSAALSILVGVILVECVSLVR